MSSETLVAGEAGWGIGSPAQGLLLALEEGRLSWCPAPTITCQAQPNRRERQRQAPCSLLPFTLGCKRSQHSGVGTSCFLHHLSRVSGCTLCQETHSCHLRYFLPARLPVCMHSISPRTPVPAAFSPYLAISITSALCCGTRDVPPPLPRSCSAFGRWCPASVVLPWLDGPSPPGGSPLAPKQRELSGGRAPSL